MSMTPGEGKKYIGYRRETGPLIIRILVITLEGMERVVSRRGRQKSSIECNF